MRLPYPIRFFSPFGRGVILGIALGLAVVAYVAAF